MTLKHFIQEHRSDLDIAIRRAPGMVNVKLNDSDRAEWINNDEYLYRWARSEGVRI